MMRQLPREVWVLGLVSLLMDLSSEMIHSLLPLYLVGSLGASALDVGLIEGLSESLALIVKIFSGSLSDYLGQRKKLVVLGYGLSALSKLLFPLASGSGWVLIARCTDRFGKGIRGAPRDALVADVTPADQRGAAFGLRQSLDTTGALLGPLIAFVWLSHSPSTLQTIFWIAVIPSFLAVGLLWMGIKDDQSPHPRAAQNPIRWKSLSQLGTPFLSLLVLGAILSLARFSEAFLVLKAEQSGLMIAQIPLVMVAMNLTFSLSAYPFGRLADFWSPRILLGLGLGLLIASDCLLSKATGSLETLLGIGLWGLHLGLTQGLMSKWIADTAPASLRGTAFGLFNLVAGVTLFLGNLLAGWLWDAQGASLTFLTGALFAALALLGVLLGPGLNARCKRL